MRELSLHHRARRAHYVRLLAAIVCACSASPRPAPSTERPAADQRAARAQPARPVHQDLRALRAAVAEVSLAANDPSHATIVTALNRLADVVQVDDRDAGARIDKLAAQLKESSPESRAHTEMVKRALHEAVE